MFRDRYDAASRLAERCGDLALRDPLVLGIPRGGAIIGGAMARAIGADFDIVLSRKLRAPRQPELAIGALGEDGEVYLEPRLDVIPGVTGDYLEREKAYQLEEIRRRAALLRGVRPRADVTNRSVIVTDDGIATGSTMIAALHVVRARDPHEVIVAVPVGAPERVGEIGRLCHRIICLLAPASFWAIGQFYANFQPVDEDEVVRLLSEFARGEASERPDRPGP